ncbi:MAG: ABC transporter permease [Planctomycetaceae bacterium]
MTFNPEPFEFLPAFLSWLLIFGVGMGIVALVAVIIGLLSGGRNGARAVFGGVTSGVLPLIAGIVLGLAGLVLGAIYGYMLGGNLVVQAEEAASEAVVMAGGVLGGVLGALFCGLAGLFAGGMMADTARLSPRRTWALAVLTIREAFRRKVLLVFIVFAILFMFAGWFITDVNARPELQVKVSVVTVLLVITALVLVVMLLVSCWGLPADIQARSLHTVVTKPVRRNEIVVGRLLGYVAVGSIILGIMGAIGYVWINRQVSEEAQERLVARVPIYGQLAYLDRQGNPSYRRNQDGSFVLDAEGRKIPFGIHVGDPWEYRGYIEGQSRSRAIWSFDDISQEDLGDSFRLESRFEAFRTHKGMDDKGNINRLLAEYLLVNEDEGLELPLGAFHVQEYGENVLFLVRDEEASEDAEQPIRGSADSGIVYLRPDVYDKIIGEGDGLTVHVRCLNAGQYIGMARPDLFIRTPDNPFISGFAKAVFGIWLMMVLVVAIGTSVSCFVKGPVATLLTLVVLIIGAMFHGFMDQLVAGELEGSGTIEAGYRIYDHKNPQVGLEETTGTQIMQGADEAINNYLLIWSKIIPDFRVFMMDDWVANGFDVPWNAALWPSIMITLAYLLPCLMIGYYSLKLRELEAK